MSRNSSQRGSTKGFAYGYETGVNNYMETSPTKPLVVSALASKDQLFEKSGRFRNSNLAQVQQSIKEETVRRQKSQDFTTVPAAYKLAARKAAGHGESVMRASLSSAYDAKLGDTVGSEVRIKTALSGGRRLDTSYDKKLNRSVLSDGYRESRNASVLTPRAERQKILDYMEGLPFDKRYGFKPVKLLG